MKTSVKATCRTMTFSQWMTEVDLVISQLAGGMTSSDLPDYCYADEYADEVPARQVARAAIREVMDEFIS